MLLVSVKFVLFESILVVYESLVNVICMYLELLGLRECFSLSCFLDTVNK